MSDKPTKNLIPIAGTSRQSLGLSETMYCSNSNDLIDCLRKKRDFPTANKAIFENDQINNKRIKPLNVQLEPIKVDNIDRNGNTKQISESRLVRESDESQSAITNMDEQTNKNIPNKICSDLNSRYPLIKLNSKMVKNLVKDFENTTNTLNFSPAATPMHNGLQYEQRERDSDMEAIVESDNNLEENGADVESEENLNNKNVVISNEISNFEQQDEGLEVVVDIEDEIIQFEVPVNVPDTQEIITNTKSRELRQSSINEFINIKNPIVHDAAAPSTSSGTSSKQPTFAVPLNPPKKFKKETIPLRLYLTQIQWQFLDNVNKVSFMEFQTFTNIYDVLETELKCSTSSKKKDDREKFKRALKWAYLDITTKKYFLSRSYRFFRNFQVEPKPWFTYNDKKQLEHFKIQPVTVVFRQIFVNELVKDIYEKWKAGAGRTNPDKIAYVQKIFDERLKFFQYDIDKLDYNYKRYKEQKMLWEEKRQLEIKRSFGPKSFKNALRRRDREENFCMEEPIDDLCDSDDDCENDTSIVYLPLYAFYINFNTLKNLKSAILRKEKNITKQQMIEVIRLYIDTEIQNIKRTDNEKNISLKGVWKLIPHYEAKLKKFLEDNNMTDKIEEKNPLENLSLEDFENKTNFKSLLLQYMKTKCPQNLHLFNDKLIKINIKKYYLTKYMKGVIHEDLELIDTELDDNASSNSSALSKKVCTQETIEQNSDVMNVPTKDASIIIIDSDEENIEKVCTQETIEQNSDVMIVPAKDASIIIIDSDEDTNTSEDLFAAIKKPSASPQLDLELS